MSISNYYEDMILNHMIRNQAFTPPSAIYVSLHTADPGETGTSEVTGGSYARQVITFGAPSNGVITVSNTPEFSGMPAQAGIGWVGLWDSLLAGSNNCLWLGALTTPRDVLAGDTLRLTAFTVTLT